MITKLTKKQEAQIPKFIEKYVALAGKLIIRKKAINAITAWYKSIGEEKPIVIFAESPFSAVVMCAMCHTMFNDKDFVSSKLSSKLRSQLYSQLDSQLDSQLYGQLGRQLYGQLGSQLYGQLSTQLSSQLYSQIRSKLYNQLGTQLHSQLYSQLRSQLYGQLRNQLSTQLSRQLYSQLSRQLYSQLHSQLSRQLSRQLGRQLSSQLDTINNDWYLLIWWLIRAGWYEYGKYIGVRFDTTTYQLFMEIVTNLSFIIPYKGIVFVSENPKHIEWQTGRLHSITGPAVEYKDGYKLYSINSVMFDEELWKKVTSPDITAAQVFAIENMEQRRAAYEIMDKKKMKELEYQTRDVVEDDGYGYKMELIEFTIDGFDEPFRYLNCFCPNTGREYFLETKRNTCWEAKMGSFGLTEDYRFTKEA